MKTLKEIGSSIKKITNKIVTPISKMIFKLSNLFSKKNKVFENWLSQSNTLLFISLIIAIIIFVVIDQKIITYSENSAEVLQAQKINVLYDEDNYVVEGIPENVDITLIGNKADLYIAKQSPVSGVSIDLWGLKPGTHKVDIKYDQISSSIKYSVNPSTATVVIYEKVTDSKTLSVDLLNQDSLDQKYIIDSVKASVETVVIKDANYKVEQVATVKALVDIKSLPKFELGQPIKVTSTLKAYDEKGNAVDVEISPAKVDVEILINSPSKEVPIKIVSTGNVKYNMGISNFAINGKASETVTIYGPSDVIANIDNIPVNIDVSELVESTEYKIELEKPSGVKNMSINNVTVKVELNSDISNVEIPNVTISKVNANSNYGVAPLDTDTITVKVKGVTDIVKNLTAEDITAYIDLEGLGIGTHEVDVIIRRDDPRVEYLSSVLKVKVKIFEK